MNPYIQVIADREGKTPEEIRNSIQKALELAWASKDPQHICARKKLTGSQVAPNPEDFIAAVVKEIQKRK